MEKSCRKCTPKAGHRPLFNFGKNPKQPLHARNSLKIKHSERRSSKNPIKFFSF